MRSFKSGLFTFTIAGIVGMAAVIGCSADGASDVIEDQSPTDPGTGSSSGSSLPASNPTDDDPPKTDASTKKDASTKTDAAKDAGPPPPNPGDTCTQVDKIFSKTCGKCGKQEAICLDNGAGKLTVSDYGQCLGETGVCVPGSTETAACGNCGTLTKTCNNYCAWTSSTCAGQPTNSCAPNSVEYTTAGCTAPNTYRSKTCGATCIWGATSPTCAEPVNANKLTISGTLNGVVNGTGYQLTTSQQGKRQPLYSCGASASLSTTTTHPFQIVELANPDSTKTATIKVSMTGTPIVEVALNAYPNNLPPMTDAELKACTTSDWGYTSSWPDIYGVTIPPSGKIIVRIQSYYQSSQTMYAATGAFGLAVTTTALN
jgi:hypothetical protein